MIGSIQELSNAIEPLPKHIATGGLALSVAGVAYGFFTSLPLLCLFTFFSLSFAVSTYREYTQVELREAHSQISARVQELSFETARLKEEIDTMVEATTNLGAYVDELQHVKEELAKTQYLLGQEVYKLHHVQHQLTRSANGIHQLVKLAISGAYNLHPPRQPSLLLNHWH